MAFFSRNNDRKDDVREPEAPPVRLAATPVASVTPPPVATVTPEPPKVAPAAEPPTLSAEGSLDFQAIYQFAHVPSTPFTAEQTLAMLEQLPPAMPLEMKRQTVQVTLTALGGAIGANRHSIVADADQKRTTLQQFASAQGKKTDESVADAETQIAELQRQIAEKENQIATAKGKQERVRTLCDTEAARLESVLSFFGEGVAAPVAAPVTKLTLDEVSEKDSELSPILLEDDEASEELPLKLAA